MLFLIFVLIVLVFLSLVQKYYSLAVFYPMLGGLLFGSWLLTMNSYHPHEISWGINEYVQDQISNDWGLEKFYQMALKSIEKDNERIHWFWDFRPTVENQVFIGTFTYSKKISPQAISQILISAHGAEDEIQRGKFNNTAWNNHYIFHSDEKMMEKMLTQEKSKKGLLVLMTAFIMLLAVSYKFIPATSQKATNIYLACLALVPLSTLYIAATYSPGLYFTPPPRYLEKLGDKQLFYHISQLCPNISYAGTFKSNDSDLKYFVCRPTFLAGDYIRINIDRFQYLYYAKNKEKIVSSPQMKLISLGHDLYLGKYDYYMKKSNSTTLFFIFIWSSGALALIIFYVIFFRKRRKIHHL